MENNKYRFIQDKFEIHGLNMFNEIKLFLSLYKTKLVSNTAGLFVDMSVKKISSNFHECKLLHHTSK